LNNLLTTFYIKPAADDQEGAIEFAHKSFGEFLFAERLKKAIEDWSKAGAGERRREQYLVPKEELHWKIYDLLGYGGLTPEITDYLMVMLEDSREWNPVIRYSLEKPSRSEAQSPKVQVVLLIKPQRRGNLLGQIASTSSHTASTSSHTGSMMKHIASQLHH
jgi:hypothetical protein